MNEGHSHALCFLRICVVVSSVLQPHIGECNRVLARIMFWKAALMLSVTASSNQSLGMWDSAKNSGGRQESGSLGSIG